MSITVDMRGILLPNSTSPIFASTYPNGNRPTGSWNLASGHFESHLSPVIVYPRPDGESSVYARHRNNYTGQNYRIPVVVEGGAWPFYYELTAAPSGMTIGTQLDLVSGELVAGTNYGIITWSNTPAGTYTVTVRVTDQNLVVNTVTFQLVVGTADWIFLDPSAGTNGSGTLASPYNTLAALSGLTTKKILFRAGTVDWEQKTVGLQSMPVTYLPYSGESVLMKQALSPIGCNGGNDFGFFGMKFFIPSDRTAVSQFFRLDGGCDRVCFFDCEFDGGSFNNTETTGGEPKSNSSILMWQNTHAGLNGAGNSFYSIIKNCKFINVRDRDMFLGYSMKNVVVEGNSMEGCTVGSNGLGHGFYFKTNVEHATFRLNYSIGTANTQKLIRIDAYAGDSIPMDYYDVSYNTFRYYGSDASGDGTGAISNSHEYVEAGTHRYIFRNTLYSQSAAAIHARGQGSASVITATNNVMVSGGTNTNGVQLVDYQGTFINTGYVAGNTSVGIVDSNNKLSGAYISNLGTKGAQVA